MWPLGVLKAPSLVKLDLPFFDSIADESNNYLVSVIRGTPQFIGNRLYMDGSTTISFPSEAINFSTYDFTVEGFFEVSSLTAGGYILNKIEGQLGLRFSITGLGAVRLYIVSTTSNYQINTADNLVLTNIRYHFAIVRTGSTLTLYINGNSVGSVSVLGAFIGGSAGVNVAIGSLVSAGFPTSYFGNLIGYLDHFKITRKAIYTANFTPPSV